MTSRLQRYRSSPASAARRRSAFGFLLLLLAGCGGDASSPDVAPAVSVTASGGSASVSSGRTVQLSASYSDNKGKRNAAATFTWSTDNVAVATVSASGLVTGIVAGTANISATSAGTTGQLAVSVTAGPAAKLVVTTQPAGATTGVLLATQPVVEVRDLADNLVTTATSAIEVLLAVPSGQLTGTTLVRAVGGVARFTDLVLSGPIGARSLQFVSGGLSAATSATFPLQPGPPTGIVLVGGLSSLRSGVPSSVAIQLRDREGNDAPLAGRRVAAAVVGGAGVATITNATALTDAQGRATFASLTLTGIAGTRQLSFTADSIAAPITATVVLRGGRPTRLSFERDVPLLAEQGVALSPAPVVRLVDSLGNTAPEAGVSVRATLVSGPGTLANGTAATDTSGRATFAGLRVDGVSGVVNLQFAVTGLPTVFSRSIAVAPPDTSAQPAFITTSVTAADTTERVLVLANPTASVTPYLQTRNASNAPMTTTGVRWTSRDPSRATVSPDGRITGVREGRTFIVAQASRTPAVADSILVFVPKNATGPLLRVQLPQYRITTDTFSIIIQVESRDGRPLSAADVQVAWPGAAAFPFSPFTVTSVTPLRSGVTATVVDVQENVGITWASATPVSGTVSLVRLNCRVNQRNVANQLVLTMRQLIAGDLTDLTSQVSVFNPLVIIR